MVYLPLFTYICHKNQVKVGINILYIDAMGRYSSHKQRGATFQRHCIAGIATILREGGRTEAMPRGRVIHWCEGSRDLQKKWGY